MIKPEVDDYGDGLWPSQLTAKGAKHPVIKWPELIMGALVSPADIRGGFTEIPPILT
jgi:hypothetical protein